MSTFICFLQGCFFGAVLSLSGLLQKGDYVTFFILVVLNSILLNLYAVSMAQGAKNV